VPMVLICRPHNPRLQVRSELHMAFGAPRLRRRHDAPRADAGELFEGALPGRLCSGLPHRPQESVGPHCHREPRVDLATGATPTAGSSCHDLADRVIEGLRHSSTSSCAVYRSLLPDAAR
jgi:hypothetical protein